MKDNILILDKISKKFGDKQILNNVSLNVKEGLIYGIVGRNGSGKTVLLKIISGMYIQDSGDIIYNGVSVHNDFGIMVDIGFLPNETGLKNLKIIAELCKSISIKECVETMQYVGLDPFNKTKFRDYSAGMKQKLAFAQAIMENPKVIILDEPFNAMDQQSVDKFRSCLLELKKKGKTIIITSHQSEDIRLLCDVVYKMDSGSISEVKNGKEKKK